MSILVAENGILRNTGFLGDTQTAIDLQHLRHTNPL